MLIQTQIREIFSSSPSTANLHFLSLVKDKEADRNYTYRSFVHSCLAVSAYLSKHSRQGDKVVILLPHSAELNFCIAGSMLGGFVPAVFAHPSQKQSEHCFNTTLLSLLHSTKARVVITTRDLNLDITAIRNSSCDLSHILFAEDITLEETSDFPIVSANADDVAVLQFSSGTTGLKKGVALSHNMLLSQVSNYADAIGLNPDSDVVASWLPLYHDMGLIACYMLPLLTGTKLVSLDPFEWINNPLLLIEKISQHRGTICWMPNFAFSLFAKLDCSKLSPACLASMRAFISCAEPVQYKDQQRFYEKFSKFGLTATAVQSAYAMAENTFCVTQTDLGGEQPFDVLDTIALQKGEIVSVPPESEHAKFVSSSGTALPNVRIKILSETGINLPERSLGEISIQGASLFDGYYSHESSDVFNGDRYFKTGDLGYLSAGHLYVMGRSADMIIHGGINLIPDDIENLLSQEPGVVPGRCVAFGVYSEARGTEDFIVMAEVADVEAAHSAKLTTRIAGLLQREFLVIPWDIVILEKNTLLKSTSGKISRDANRSLYLARKECEVQSLGDNSAEIAESIILNYLPVSRLSQPDYFLKLADIIDSLSYVSMMVGLSARFNLPVLDNGSADLTCFETIDSILKYIACQEGNSSTERTNSEDLYDAFSLSVKQSSLESHKHSSISHTYWLIGDFWDKQLDAYRFRRNFSHREVNTCSHGFRRSLKGGELISLRDFIDSDAEKGVVIGNSLCFGYGSSSDHIVSHNLFNQDAFEKGKDTIWYNFALSDPGLAEQIRLYQHYVDNFAMSVDYLVWYDNQAVYEAFSSIPVDHQLDMLRKDESAFNKEQLECYRTELGNKLDQFCAIDTSQVKHCIYVLAPIPSFMQRAFTDSEVNALKWHHKPKVVSIEKQRQYFLYSPEVARHVKEFYKVTLEQLAEFGATNQWQIVDSGPLLEKLRSAVFLDPWHVSDATQISIAQGVLKYL